MKNLKPLLAQLLVISSLMLPWTTTEALETFGIGGVISKVDISSLKLHRSDRTYRIKPTAEIIIPGVLKPRMSDLKKGDVVSLKGHAIGSTYYVERLIYQDVSNE
ncbi:MAG: hypothetical protein GY802_17015 [Gammaproteobacteria bacterium]|nr:hypothetical protein [Gammaproteobacteria bacterium]